MSITTYSELKTSIANYLHKANLTSAIPEFITDAEARIYRELRVRQMETAFSSAISSGVVALPTGFLEWRFLYVDGDSAVKLEAKDAEWIYTNYPIRSAEGKPVYFAREGENVIFGPYPDSAYTIKGAYYKKLTALSDSNPTNWLITDAPDLIRYAALCEAAPYCRDDVRIPIWESKYETIKQDMIRAEKRMNLGGSVLRMT